MNILIKAVVGVMVLFLSGCYATPPRGDYDGAYRKGYNSGYNNGNNGYNNNQRRHDDDDHRNNSGRQYRQNGERSEYHRDREHHEDRD